MTSITNVLAVDDDVAVCRILQRMLSDEQYQVQITQSVAEAVGAIEKKSFDVYVMDYKLPDGTGLDIAERIRSKGSEAPIILISGYEPSAVALRAEELHIFDIIEKPFSREVICNAVKKAIGFTATAEQARIESLNSSVRAPDKAVAKTGKGIPNLGITIGIIVILLLAAVAYYLLTQGH